MIVRVFSNEAEMGEAAAAHGAQLISDCIARKGKARIVLSTGASQFKLFEAFAAESIDWSRVEAFHLDEYIGLPITHKASFRKYLKERFVDVYKPGSMRFVDATGGVEDEIARLSADLIREPIDLGFIGIGENAHIAFNDPPADFATMQPYIVVTLNDTCKAQQVREGWFDTVDDVPKTAVSMSVQGILQCNAIISCVPGVVKAKAMFDTLTSAVSPMVPATKLKEHKDVTVYLDEGSAGSLTSDLLSAFSG